MIKNHKRNDKEKQNLCVRLRRIEGQIKAVEKMVLDDAPCVETMRLINSASGALKGVLTKVLTDHLTHCVTSVVAKKDTAAIDELSDFFKTLK